MCCSNFSPASSLSLVLPLNKFGKQSSTEKPIINNNYFSLFSQLYVFFLTHVKRTAQTRMRCGPRVSALTSCVLFSLPLHHCTAGAMQTAPHESKESILYFETILILTDQCFLKNYKTHHLHT